MIERMIKRMKKKHLSDDNDHLDTEKILVSACLLGNHVRYDGKKLVVESDILQEWADQKRTVPFCPEVSGGLPVPRSPSEIRGGDGYSVLSGNALVYENRGNNVTAQFIQGARSALAVCMAQHIKMAVLSESSPSCGSKTIYNGHFSNTKIAGVGVTTALLQKHHIRVFSQHTLQSAAEYLVNLETGNQSGRDFMEGEYTHISIILDRTGSMESIRDDIIGGFNAFLKEQKQQTSGTATLTLVQFDTQDPYEVIHQFASVQSVDELTRQTFVPRASTPLLDAIGRGINDLEQSLGAMKLSQRPQKIVFVIITDGQENSSLEFSKNLIVKMIQEKRDREDWQFVFLSADLYSIDDAKSYGFHESATMSYDKSTDGITAAWESLSTVISDYREAKTKTLTFTEKDRKRQTSETNRHK
jgi:uncharacterized protein YbbK (DUF523 family)